MSSQSKEIERLNARIQALEAAVEVARFTLEISGRPYKAELDFFRSVMSPDEEDGRLAQLSIGRP